LANDQAPKAGDVFVTQDLKSSFDVDLFVIGGGFGGVRAARIAASHGAKVMLAEEFRLGGTCVIRGCIPKKLFVYAGRFSARFEQAPTFGWDIATPHFDWPSLVAAKEREISRLEGIYARGQKAAWRSWHRAPCSKMHTRCG
jgi:glutathione reductase (NADPH)